MKITLQRFALSLCTASALALAGCGGQPEKAETATQTAPDAPSSSAPSIPKMQVALLTPGDINDAGWNQLAYEGLQAIEKESGARTAHQVTKNTSEHQPALRDFGDQKFDLVLCHGFEYGERVLQVAPKFPDTKFVVVGGNVKQEPNVATLVPKLEEATYLLGMAAGGMTKSNAIGCIGGMKLPVIVSTFLAFEQGAKAANPKVRVLTEYVGNFEDQNKGKEAANSLIAHRCDFIFHNADQAGKGMFDAAKTAKGVLVFGSNRNQNQIAPSLCLASAVIEMPRAFVEVASSVRDKKFKPGFIELNIPNGNISVQWNAPLRSKVPAALMEKIEAAQAQIKAGKLKVKRNV